MTPRYSAFFAAAAVMVLSAATSLPAFAQGDMETPGIASGVVGTRKALVTITAGVTGAPVGFTIWWMKQSDYLANGNEWFLYGDTRQGEAYFWGTPEIHTNDGQYTTFHLAPNQSITVEIGDLFDESGVTYTPPTEDIAMDGELQDNTPYVFCAYANGTPQIYQSGLTLTVQSTTQTQNCTFTQGYWKNHASAWPASCLPMTLGNNSYTQAQLLQIFGQSVKGNGAVSMSHQLIAAKLNICQGAIAGSAVNACIASAQSLLSSCGSNKIPPIGTCSLSTTSTDSANSCLDNFNNGLSGPGHCGTTAAPTTSWGKLKAIYR